MKRLTCCVSFFLFANTAILASAERSWILLSEKTPIGSRWCAIPFNENEIEKYTSDSEQGKSIILDENLWAALSYKLDGGLSLSLASMEGMRIDRLSGFSEVHTGGIELFEICEHFAKKFDSTINYSFFMNFTPTTESGVGALGYIANISSIRLEQGSNDENKLYLDKVVIEILSVLELEAKKIKQLSRPQRWKFVLEYLGHKKVKVRFPKFGGVFIVSIPPLWQSSFLNPKENSYRLGEDLNALILSKKTKK